MGNLRYSELKYDGKVYDEQWKIDEILIKNKFNWVVNAEIANARIEIFNDTFVWNAGIWFNGIWEFGVFRDGEWRYGTWKNGVFYNGVWRNGTFESGIIYNGKFFKGKINGGEIRGGQFIDMIIDQKVQEFTSDEYKAKEEEKKMVSEMPVEVAAQPEQPQGEVRINGQVKVRSTPPASAQIQAQPQAQPIQNENYKMKNIKKFTSFIKESYNTNLDEANSYYEVIESFPVWIEAGWKDTNASYNGSRISQMSYKESVAEVGDQIQNLYGGIFLTRKSDPNKRLGVKASEPDKDDHPFLKHYGPPRIQKFPLEKLKKIN